MKTGILWITAATALFLTSCEVDGVYLDDFLNNIDLDHGDDDNDGNWDTGWDWDTEGSWDSEGHWETDGSRDTDWVDEDTAMDTEGQWETDGVEDTDWVEDTEDTEDTAVDTGWEVWCGNGIIEGDEMCDDGILAGEYNGCAPGCVLGPYCGDGIVNGTEACDDGNRDKKDGCNNRCKIR